MSEVAALRRGEDIAQIMEALVRADGTQNHGHAVRAGAGGGATALSLSDLADAVHYLCMLHGRQPGVIDHAATRSTDNGARNWLVQATGAFAAERGYLTQVAVALGPIPSTAGQADCEAAVSHQRHALDMLAQSDRRGTAMGAAATLVLDWDATRRVLDAAAIRAGIEPQPCTLPDRAATLNMVRAIGGDDGIDRALQFGSRQLLTQHRGLWDLLAARADVRSRQP
ncbi:MAG: hypothetical protein ABW039_14410 [Sphingobium sp.]